MPLYCFLPFGIFCHIFISTNFGNMTLSERTDKKQVMDNYRVTLGTHHFTEGSFCSVGKYSGLFIFVIDLTRSDEILRRKRQTKWLPHMLRSQTGQGCWRHHCTLWEATSSSCQSIFNYRVRMCRLLTGNK